MSEQIIEDEYKKYKDDISVATKCQNTEDNLCSGCPNEWGDKEYCSEHCLRLIAFQYNKPYEHIKFYCSQEHAESLKDAQIANKAGETPKTVKPITPKTTPWKKAMPKKQKKEPIMAQKPKGTIPAPMTYEEKMKIIRETTVCLQCGRDASKYKLRRGLCLAKCSGAWRDNRISHPLLGMWKKMTIEEINESRWGKYKECLIPGCDIIGGRSELCRKHYRQWHDGYIEKPGVGKWFPKGQKKKGENPMEEQAKYEIKTPTIMDKAADEVLGEMISHTVLLDFTKYQEIYGELKAQVKLSRLPLNHVIFNLLSLGIMTAHEEERRRNGVQRKELSDGV